MKKAASIFGILATLALAGTASAFPIIGSNGTQSGEAEVTLGAGTVTITIKNTTAHTASAGDLLTKFTLQLSGLTAGTATSGTSAGSRNVAGDGTFTSVAGPLNLLSGGLNTWTGGVSGNVLSMDFHPEAKYALIGPTDGDGLYHGNGSINGNPGHNPFAYDTVTFTFNATGVTPQSQVLDADFYFGTDFGTNVPGGGGGATPEPASLGVLGIGAAALLMRRRKAKA